MPTSWETVMLGPMTAKYNHSHHLFGQVSGTTYFWLPSKSQWLVFICRLAKTFFAVRNKFNSLFSKKFELLIRHVCQLVNDLCYLLFVPEFPSLQQRFRYAVAAFGLFNVCAEHFSSLVNGCYLHYLTTHMMKRFDPNNN